MKKFYVLLLCFSGFILNAQNYQNICTSGITFYKNNSGYIKAFSLDSAYKANSGKLIHDTLGQMGTDDTIFISYRTIQPFLINNCFDTTNGSILGRRVYKKQDGTFYFFNYNHDTLTIKALAALYGTWKFCDLSGGSWIEAQVTNISQDTILGLADMAKVISFQAKDINGNNISNFLNQKIIKLSQHYGISETYDLYYMPDIEGNDASTYFLSGKTVSSLGIQNLTWKDIYNFDVGDEFDWTGDYWNGDGPSWETMERVLGKQVFGNMDSVKYTMEDCQILWLPQPPPNEEKGYDTIIVSYNFIKMDNGTIQDLPQAFGGGPNPHAPSYNRFIQLPGRQTQEYVTWQYSRAAGNCWGTPSEPTYALYDYSEGLGNTYTYSEEWEEWPIKWSQAMVYYKKGSETWGTPLAIDCYALLGYENKVVSHEPDIEVIPNPVETLAEISLEGFIQTDLQYILVNSFGQQVLSGEIHSLHFSFNRLDLPGGLYIMTMVDDKNSIIARIKIILE